jgi:hypothetical protein
VAGGAGIIVIVGLHVALPAKYRVNPPWVLPVVLLGLLAALIIGDPGRIDRQKTWLRVTTGIVIALLTLANLFAAALPQSARRFPRPHSRSRCPGPSSGSTSFRRPASGTARAGNGVRWPGTSRCSNSVLACSSGASTFSYPCTHDTSLAQLPTSVVNRPARVSVAHVTVARPRTGRADGP